MKALTLVALCALATPAIAQSKKYPPVAPDKDLLAEKRSGLWEATLHPDSTAENDACTAQAIAYNVFAAASLIANLVKRHAVGDEVPRQVVFDLKTLTLLADMA